MTVPLICVVVVNYNTSDYVEDLLRSLETTSDLSVVIVDNRSDQDNVRKLKLLEEKFTGVEAVYLSENRGFAGGVHAGVEHCKASISDYLWVLNPDTVVAEGAASRLACVLGESNFDIVSPLIVTGDRDSERIWFAGGNVDLVRGRTTHDFFGSSAAAFRGDHPDPFATGFVTGAAPMMTFGTWQSVGGFRTDLFMYWEDADFSRRASMSGLRLAVVPDAEVWHAVGASSGTKGKSPLYYRYMLRNRIICMSEANGARSLLTLAASTETVAMFVRASRGGEGKYGRISAVLKGIREGVGIARSGSRRQTQIEVCTSRAFESWEARHERGEVPSRHPYGLEHLRSEATEVRSSALAPVKSVEGVSKAASNLVRRIAHSTSPTVGVSWDENHAVRMMLQKNYVRKYSGLIWATDELPELSLVRRLVLERALGELDGIWCLSNAQIEVLEDWLGSGCPPVHHVTFGIDTSFFTPQAMGDRPVVASIGVDRDRDRSTLLEAFDLVLDQRPEAQLVVQGDLPLGTVRHANVRVVKSLSHAEVRTLYGEASVVAVSTRPNLHVSGMTVALEAMATGRPVVMSRTQGMDDYVSDGVAGTLVEPANTEQLANGILGYLNDRSSRLAAGERGVEIVRRQHTSQQMVESIAAIIAGSR